MPGLSIRLSMSISSLLTSFLDDPEVSVRRLAATRAPTTMLAQYARDRAWEVRWEVAVRAPERLARELAMDIEPEVRAAARERLGQLAHGPG